jgi:hypothetical protein
MRVPFGALMEFAAALTGEDGSRTLGELARQAGEEDAWRLADAIDAVQVMRGRAAYIRVAESAGKPAARPGTREDP